MVEHLAVNERVPGSNPGRGAKILSLTPRPALPLRSM